MKYILKTTTVQYFKHEDGTEVFFRGKFSPEANLPLFKDIADLIADGKIKIIEREEEAFVEEIVGHVVPRNHYAVVRSYPDMKEQLDMIWHEVNNNGSVSTEGEWFKSIKSVKEQHPKPNN